MPNAIFFNTLKANSASVETLRPQAALSKRPTLTT